MPATRSLLSSVARNPDDPGRKWNSLWLIAPDEGHQLEEHMLGCVLGIVFVTDDTKDISVDIILVSQV